jgi:hypothetical protein
MPVTHWKTALATALCAAAYCQPSLAQAPPAAVLEIDVENQVDYRTDVFDYSRFATDPNPTTTAGATKTFATFVNIADIIAVNGKPARGTAVSRQTVLRSASAPVPGQAIADVERLAILEFMWEILDEGGVPIGSIMASGMNFGSPPPGSPSTMLRDNMTITGGTGAFLGIRGQAGSGPNISSSRQASVTEDPSNRRRNGGGAARKVILRLIPMSRPEIVTIANGPAVTHSNDFSLVTASKPAAAGEILSLFVTGLGPTKPAVDPSTPFPASPPAVVNSPVGVTVNGKPAEVTGAVGYPGAVDGYQVNFRIPSDTSKGTATVQVSAAWIAGPAAIVAIQ